MLHHVEVQKVFYFTYRLEAENEEVARALASKKYPGDVVGRKLLARNVTNAHPITDTCAVRGCEKHFPDALDELADDGHLAGGV